jgi:hypothetical protein
VIGAFTSPRVLIDMGSSPPITQRWLKKYCPQEQTTQWEAQIDFHMLRSLLLKSYKIIEKFDAAGVTFNRIFREKKNINIQSLRVNILLDFF